MKARSGIQTGEFIVGIIAVILLILQQELWPDSPFPKESFIALGVWILGRTGEKVLGDVHPETGKRFYQTSEWWVASGFAVVKYIYPELPPVVENFILVYVLGRPAVKVSKGFTLPKLLKGSK